MYANDASNFRQVPIGVVIPRTLDDVVATMVACHRYRAPMLYRGGGTSLSGETVNYAVVIDYSKYLTGIGEVDPVSRAPRHVRDRGDQRAAQRGDREARGWSSAPTRRRTPAARSAATSATTPAAFTRSSPSCTGRARAPRTTRRRWRSSPTTVSGSGSASARKPGSTRSSPPAGARARSTRSCATCATATPTTIRSRLPARRRAAAAGVGLQPRRAAARAGLQRRPRPGRHREHLRDRAAGHAAADPGAAAAHAGASSSTTTLADGGEHVMEIIERWKPIGLEAIDQRLIEDQQLEAMHVAGPAGAAAPGRAGGVAAGAVRRGHRRGVGGPRAASSSRGCAEDKGYAADRIMVIAEQAGGRRQRATCGQSARAVWARPRFRRTASDHWPGWEDSAVPPDAGRATTCATCKALYAKYG